MTDVAALLERPHCLILDPDPAAVATARETILAREPNARATTATHLARTLALLSGPSPPTCIVTELRLPDAEGAVIVRTLRARCPSLPILVWTAAGSEEAAVAALRAGALDYVAKREGPRRLADGVRDLLGRAPLVAADAVTASDPDTPLAADAPVGPLVARSPSMRHVLRLVDRASRSAVPVLLQGETGSGKELVARAIHERGPRQREPFLVQNCAALPDTLLESELFGHVRGAFTGATRDRPGLFLNARGGTVLLDEIGDAPPPVQARLLRVLENGEVKPLGADRVVHITARVVAATNRRLEVEVERGSFRSDLLYRLNVFAIDVPPLRHRIGDLPDLARQLLARAAEQEQRPTGGLSPDALEALCTHAWPGNVRELAHELHRLVLTLPAGTRIRRAHLPPALRSSRGHHGDEPLAAILARVETSVLLARLSVAPSKAAAARSLGLTREGLYRRLRRAREAQ